MKPMWSFSTLYGSKWVATVCGCLFLRRSHGVSVPSTGRSGLQLDNTAHDEALYNGFSTLYGSKWVATGNTRAALHCLIGFSTLYGSKWVATGNGVSVTLVDGGFSTLYGSKWVATPLQKNSRLKKRFLD